MWKLKIGQGGIPWLRTTNEHVGRQVWEFDPELGRPEEIADVENAREAFRQNRFNMKHSADILMRLQVSLPFLVIHGGGDTMTAPSVSTALYETASSKDKTFKLYPRTWHASTSAESQQNIHLLFSDILSWLDERSMKMSLISEMENKICHDNQKMKFPKSMRTQVILRKGCTSFLMHIRLANCSESVGCCKIFYSDLG